MAKAGLEFRECCLFGVWGSAWGRWRAMVDKPERCHALRSRVWDIVLLLAQEESEETTFQFF